MALALRLVGPVFAIAIYANAAAQSSNEYPIYFGTYTGTAGKGIYAYRFRPATAEMQSLGLVAGRFLYVSNRGHDSIAIFSIDHCIRTGSLSSWFVKFVGSFGSWVS